MSKNAFGMAFNRKARPFAGEMKEPNADGRKCVFWETSFPVWVGKLPYALHEPMTFDTYPVRGVGRPTFIIILISRAAVPVSAALRTSPYLSVK